MTTKLSIAEEAALDLFDNNIEDTHKDLFASISFIGAICYANAVQKGFWDEERPKGTMIALIHSELSEMLEAVRKPGSQSEKCPGLTAEEEEWADALIRLFDYGRGHNLRLGIAFLEKMRYNRARPRMHGKVL